MREQRRRETNQYRPYLSNGYNISVTSRRRTILNNLCRKVSALPTGPGVYLFKDAKGVVL
jgi:hypothetical protein